MADVEIEKAVAARFKRDTEKHVITIKHDDGLYRHVRYQAPGSSSYWFDLITWPGWLTISGDMGTYTFSRVEDMFTFFRRGPVNPQYWGEKLQDGGDERTTAYSESHFKKLVNEHLADLGDDLNEEQAQAKKELLEALSGGDGYYEEGAREILRAAEASGLLSDVWEWSLRDWDFHFLWCLNAIVAGIAQFDAAKTAEAVSPR